MTTWRHDQWADAIREAERRIAHGWYAALCAAVFHAFIGGLVSAAVGGVLGRLLYPAGLVFLAWAVSRHSRIGAGILTAQAGWVYGGLVVRDHSVFAFLLLIGFGYWYVSSVVGTVRYHRLQRERPVPAEITSRPSTAAGA